MGNIMIPLKKFLSNKNTITILGVLIGIVVLYVGYNWRVTKTIQPVSVPISATTMISGTKITDEQIKYTEMPKDVIADMQNILTNIKDIKGKIVSYDSKIAQNSFFFDENVMNEEEMPDSLFSNIPDGYTLFALEVDNKKTYGNSIMPDNTIDLYLKGESDDGYPLYGRFISSIQVLAVRDKKGKDVFIDRYNPGEPAVMSFAVLEEHYLLLKRAELAGFEIHLVGRNASYSEDPDELKIASHELKDMIIDRNYILSDECSDLVSDCYVEQ